MENKLHTIATRENVNGQENIVMQHDSQQKITKMKTDKTPRYVLSANPFATPVIAIQ